MKVAAQAVTAYGTVQIGAFTTAYAGSVYLVEDAIERHPVAGWKARPGEIIGVDAASYPSVNFYYHDAYAMPADDTTDLGLPAIYRPLLVLGALIEALESRHDTGVRGEPQPTGPHQEVSLIDRLQSRYDNLKNEMAMSLPGVVI